MSNLIKRYSLTPAESAEKALIVERLRVNPRGPWVNGKKTVLPKSRRAPGLDKKKK